MIGFHPARVLAFLTKAAVREILSEAIQAGHIR